MKVIVFFLNLQFDNQANELKKETFITCCTRYFFLHIVVSSEISPKRIYEKKTWYICFDNHLKGDGVK
jgi:hypothetical protein